MLGFFQVFYGDMLVGPRLPNLTYMLSYENMAARDKAWAAFVSAPAWKKMTSDPRYCVRGNRLQDHECDFDADRLFSNLARDFLCSPVSQRGEAFAASTEHLFPTVAPRHHRQIAL